MGQLLLFYVELSRALYSALLGFLIYLCARFGEFDGFLLHSSLECGFFTETLFGGVLAYVFRYFHGAEMWAAH